MSVAVAHNIASFSMWSSVDFPHKTERARTFWRRCHTLIKTLFVKRPGLVWAQWDKKNNLKVSDKGSVVSEKLGGTSSFCIGPGWRPN